MSHTRHPNRKVVNFAAGPSAMPYEVLEQAQKELLDYDGLGTSVMEISHRSPAFSKIITKTEALVRELLSVPDNYKIMFLQGGGSGQFSAVPMNILSRNPNKTASYFVSGYWSAKAYAECQKYGTANLVFPKLDKFNRVPPSSEWSLSSDVSYVFLCDNETIDGVELNESHIDEIRRQIGPDVPIVADCSSNLFSRPFDVSKFGIVFGGAQKNFGPAGVTCVIVRDDLIGLAMKECPSVLDYKLQSAANSLYHTPPCFGIYMCGLVYEWLKSKGGMESVGNINKTKSELVYDVISRSNGFYRTNVASDVRSRMTIPFRVCQNSEPNDALEKKFISEAAKQNLKELKGHRSVGGIRAAIFNALSMEEVQSLADYMKKFQADHQ